MKSKLRESKRIIALPDIHYPENIDLTPIEKFMEDFKPTHIVYLGDVLDLSYLCSLEESNIEMKENKRLVQDYEQVKAMFQRHKKTKAKLIWLLGNHENRIEKVISKQPSYLRGFIEIKKYFKGVVDEILPYGVIWRGGANLGYFHGSHCNQNHAKKHAQEFEQMSIIYGHTHDRQLCTKMNARDTKPKPRYAQSIGCLCNLNPDYLKRKALGNKWVHAFSIAYVWGKFFNEYTIHIVNNQFCYNGKMY